jgi:hypothetical protein
MDKARLRYVLVLMVTPAVVAVVLAALSLKLMRE